MHKYYEHVEVLSTEDFLKGLVGTIALIGNSTFPVVKGKEIDLHDNVIRMNNFQIGGYEEIVGCTTTAWCTNTWPDVPYRDLGIPTFTPISIGSRSELRRIESWINKTKCPKLMCCTYAYLTEFEHQYFSQPTTGTLLLYILDCLSIPVTIFGFDGFASGHYFNPKAKVTSHSKVENQRFLADLITKGVVTYG